MGGLTKTIGHQKAVFRSLQAIGSVDQLALRTLADGNDHPICLNLHRSRIHSGLIAILIKENLLKYRAVIIDFHRLPDESQLRAIQLCVGSFS